MMKKHKLILLTCTHLCTAAFSFALGLYMLPILIAPPAPSAAEVETASAQALYSGEFTRELEGSDHFHWGEGKITINSDRITFMGELAPGPDYKLYLSPDFVETEAQFERLKPSMVMVGDVKTFNNFIVEVKPDIDLTSFNTVVVWCESFGEFITAARYNSKVSS